MHSKAINSEEMLKQQKNLLEEVIESRIADTTANKNAISKVLSFIEEHNTTIQQQERQHGPNNSNNSRRMNEVFNQIRSMYINANNPKGPFNTQKHQIAKLVELRMGSTILNKNAIAEFFSFIKEHTTTIEQQEGQHDPNNSNNPRIMGEFIEQTRLNRQRFLENNNNTQEQNIRLPGHDKNTQIKYDGGVCAIEDFIDAIGWLLKTQPDLEIGSLYFKFAYIVFDTETPISEIKINLKSTGETITDSQTTQKKIPNYETYKELSYEEFNNLEKDTKQKVAQHAYSQFSIKSASNPKRNVDQTMNFVAANANSEYLCARLDTKLTEGSQCSLLFPLIPLIHNKTTNKARYNYVLMTVFLQRSKSQQDSSLIKTCSRLHVNSGGDGPLMTLASIHNIEITQPHRSIPLMTTVLELSVTARQSVNHLFFAARQGMNNLFSSARQSVNNLFISPLDSVAGEQSSVYTSDSVAEQSIDKADSASEKSSVHGDFELSSVLQNLTISALHTEPVIATQK